MDLINWTLIFFCAIGVVSIYFGIREITIEALYQRAKDHKKITFGPMIGGTMLIIIGLMCSLVSLAKWIM